MLEKKQNVYDDFIAAAEWLVAQKYTSPAKLAVPGGSNGGLLTGAVLTQRPRALRGRHQRRPAPRHAPLPVVPHGALLDPRVRQRRERRPVPVPPRLLAVPPREEGDEVPRRPPHRRRERLPRPPAPRAQDGGAPPGLDRLRPGGEADPPLGRPRRRPRPGQAARAPRPRRRRPADVPDVAARDALERERSPPRGSRRPARASPSSASPDYPVRPFRARPRSRGREDMSCR